MIASRRDLLAGTSRLTEIPSVDVITPFSDELSAGIVCFRVGRRSAANGVRKGRERHIIAKVIPYATYARLVPSIRNTPDEIDAAIGEVRRLA